MDSIHQLSAFIEPLLTKDQVYYSTNLPIVFKAIVYTTLPLTVSYAWKIFGYPELTSNTKYFKIPEYSIDKDFTVEL